MKYKIVILLASALFGCKKKQDKLFWIYETTGNRNDFLFLAESTNVEKLNRDSLNLFLQDQELEKFDSSSMAYKNFGKIFDGNKFRAFVLLRSDESEGRNYIVMIRTFDIHWNVLDSYELGIWDEQSKRFCAGSISKDLVIERKCAEKETLEIMKINDQGKIVGLDQNG